MQDMLLRLLSPIHLFSSPLEDFAIYGQVDTALAGLPRETTRFVSAAAFCFFAHQPCCKLRIHLLTLQTRKPHIYTYWHKASVSSRASIADTTVFADPAPIHLLPTGSSCLLASPTPTRSATLPIHTAFLVPRAHPR